MKPTPERLNELWATPSNWRAWRCVYFCPEDPRIVVPKRMKSLGWTLNLAKFWAVPFLIGVLLLVTIPLTYLDRAGYALTGIWWAVFAVGLALVCVICRHLSSAERYRD